MTRLLVTRELVEETVRRLQVGGRRQEERALLWLARQTVQVTVPVNEVYEPEQVADVDYFRLPPSSMQALNSYLRTRRLRIAAQVHTHPGRAYHSKVDDEWAFVRHEGALSLVLPHFASMTTPSNFLQQVRIYRLTQGNTWQLAPNNGPDAALEMVP